MDAVGCDEESEKNDLESSEGCVRCSDEGGGWAGDEDGIEEIGEELGHVWMERAGRVGWMILAADSRGRGE